MQINLGWVKEPADERDYKFSGMASVLPRVNGRVEIPINIDVRNQFGGSCVANAWCHALEILASNAGVKMRRRSASALYWQARKALGWQDKDSGTHIRIAANCLQSQGVGEESMWPNESPFADKPDAAYWMTAYDGMLTEYQRINDGDCDAIEQAIFAAHPVVFGVQVGAEFLQYNGDTATVFDAPARSVGGHAMVVVGVQTVARKRQFLVLNSWSEDWGMFGQAWLSEDYMATGQDVWVGLRHPV